MYQCISHHSTTCTNQNFFSNLSRKEIYQTVSADRFSATRNRDFSMKTVLLLVGRLIVIVYQKTNCPASATGDTVQNVKLMCDQTVFKFCFVQWYSIIWWDRKGAVCDELQDLVSIRAQSFCRVCAFNWTVCTIIAMCSFHCTASANLCSVQRAVCQSKTVQCAGECLVLSVACRPAVTLLTALWSI